jgi:hypothetical protein
MSGEDVVPISERRGAVVAGALICAVLLVVGYGSGISVVPADPGGLAGAGPDPGDGSSPGGRTDLSSAPPAGGTGGVSPPTASRPGRPGGGSTPSSTIVQSTRAVLGGRIPPSTLPPATAPPGTTPPAAPPSPGTAPPGTAPPAECTSLVAALVQGLIGYLAGPDPDAALVQHVSDTLGLEQLVPDNSLLGSVTPLVDGAVSALGTTLDPVTDAAASGQPDPGLVPALRTLLGVDVTGVATVTGEQLLMRLAAVLVGC